MDKADEFLQHYGVKGMKWGVRRTEAQLAGAAAKKAAKTAPTEVSTKQTPGKRVQTSGGKNQPASSDAVAAAAAKQKAKASTLDSLSNKELQSVVQRMNLEQQYVRLSAPQKTAGQKFVQRMFKDKQFREGSVNNVRSMSAVRQVENAMAVGSAIGRTDLTKIY